MRRLIRALAIPLVTLGVLFPERGELLVQAQTGGWATMAPLPVARTGLVAVTADNGLIYAFGGTDNATQDYSDAEVYDPASNVWRGIAPLPVAESYSRAIVGNDGKIYIFGGFNSKSGQSLNNVFAYDPSTNTYACSSNYVGCTSSSLAPMPTARSVMAIAERLDGKIWTIGGYTNTPVATVEVYDPATNSWASSSPLPTPEAGAAAFVFPTGHVLVSGGFDGQQYNHDAFLLSPPAAVISSAVRKIQDVHSRPLQTSEPAVCFPDGSPNWLRITSPLNPSAFVWLTGKDDEWEAEKERRVQRERDEENRKSLASEFQKEEQQKIMQDHVNSLCSGHLEITQARSLTTSISPKIDRVHPANLPRQASVTITLRSYVAAGGSGPSGVSAAVLIGDWLHNTTTAGPSLPGPREAGAMVSDSNGTYYVIGGDDGTNVYNTVFAFTPPMITLDLPAVVTPSPTPIPTSIPAPATAAPTSTSVPTSTPAPTVTSTSVPALGHTLSLRVSLLHASIKVGAKQVITIHTLAKATVIFTASFPNGSRKRHSGTANGAGVALWAFKQPNGVTSAKNRTVRVSVHASEGGRSARVTKTYRIK